MAIGASKLTEDDVKIIKDLLSRGMTHRTIGEIFGVSRQLITSINNGKRWNEETKSFIMKRSNDYRQFTDQPKTIKSITIRYNDGTELDL